MKNDTMLFKMKDTTPEAQQLQRNIIHSKTARERVMMGTYMAESARKIAMNRIKIENSNLTERKVVAELFEMYYGQVFSEEEIQVIKKGIISYQRD